MKQKMYVWRLQDGIIVTVADSLSEARKTAGVDEHAKPDEVTTRQAIFIGNRVETEIIPMVNGKLEAK